MCVKDVGVVEAEEVKVKDGEEEYQDLRQGLGVAGHTSNAIKTHHHPQYARNITCLASQLTGARNRLLAHGKTTSYPKTNKTVTSLRQMMIFQRYIV